MEKRYCIICTFVVGVVERLRKGNQMKVLMVEIKSQHVVLPMNNPMNSSITNTRRRKQSIIRATKQRKIRLNPSPFMFTTPKLKTLNSNDMSDISRFTSMNLQICNTLNTPSTIS